MKRFSRHFFLFCLVLGGILYALFSQFGPAIIHPLTAYLFGFFALLSAVTYWFTDRLVRVSPDNFMVAYFGSMTVRMLLSVALVLVYLYRGGAREGHGMWAFLGSFFLLYFLFTGFEIWSVLSNLRPFSKPG